MNERNTLREVGRSDGHDVQWLTLGQAATYLGVADSTARKWAVEGRLPAYSTPGGHRRFRIGDLDAFLDEARVALPAHRPSVLIVDDNERERAIVRFALEADGYSVQEASTAAEGLAAVGDQPPDFILLDGLIEP